MSKHITILGAGVIGLSAALYCARRGMKVTLIDRQPAQRGGCSFGNAGMVVPSHFIPLAAPGMVMLGLKWMWNPESPFYIKPRLNLDLISWGLRFWQAATQQHVQNSAPVLRDLSLMSRECFRDLSQSLDFGLVEKGLLMLCKHERTLDEEAHTASKARELGIPAEVLDAKQTGALDPGVTMSVAGSVFFPKDCHLSPSRYLEAIEKELISRGVQFLWQTEVTGFEMESGHLTAVKTTHGHVAADEFVLASGVWSDVMARELGIRLPMQAGKGYSLTVAQPRQLPERCSIFTEARVAITPMGSSLRFGGTMEIAGIDETVNKRRVRGIVRAVPDYFPEFQESDFSDITPWSGLRPCSPDGMPYVGRTKKWKNLTLATGHAMMGLSLAPATGKIVAELIADEQPSVDLRLLSPDRFA